MSWLPNTLLWLEYKVSGDWFIINFAQLKAATGGGVGNIQPELRKRSFSGQDHSQNPLASRGNWET